MEYSTLSVTLENGIACIALDRPEVMNALNTQMRAEIAEAATSMGKEARVVVLTGAGRAFCSGQDLGDRTNAANVDMERTLRDEYEPMLRAIMDCPVPTITALNGAAAGAGRGVLAGAALPARARAARARGAAARRRALRSGRRCQGRRSGPGRGGRPPPPASAARPAPAVSCSTRLCAPLLLQLSACVLGLSDVAVVRLIN